ncbi:cilia- and flagella-associated protein 299 [Drosophila pseudoobscura]|uniref:Cilia- and flagella-associated protein 299 n=1 Tax=Drosophila pseudoobscura pseudoobscura TaxID=46245 RepID=Q29KY6_DROPS|nr:cilia- and flagella-associated protein 299 [Drosophila pseudoobscura]XP_015036614.1 cilia- and flagella-associated protein 299 [Drosophila pseudoobscura]
MSLLGFHSYGEYLDQFITPNDVRYLRNWSFQRKLIQNACGKSCLGGLLTEEEYKDRRQKEMDMLKPRGLGGLQLFGDYLNNNDRVLRQFAKREKMLLNKHLSTIVYLLMRSSVGLEVSGFIDLEQSLRESRFLTGSKYFVDWKGVFEGTVKLKPGKHHLSHYNWYKNRVVYNDSDNFQVVNEGAHSLLMKHRGDHKMICVNVGCDCPASKNARRTMYASPIYGHAIFFDHIIRRIN